jgi:hypothetical protein
VLTILIVFSSFSLSVADSTIDNMTPTMGDTTVCPGCASLCVDVNSTVGIMNITIYSNLTGVWDYFYLGTLNLTYANVSNGTYCINVPFFSEYNTTYYWKVKVDDGVLSNETVIYNFTTVIDESECDVATTGSSYSWLLAISILFSLIPILFILGKRLGKRGSKR